MSCDIQNSNPHFSGLYPQKGDPSPGNKIPYLLKPQRRSHSFEWRQEPRAQRCFYFCTAIFPAASCREQFNFLCRLISRSHFSSVSVTLLPSTRLKRVLLHFALRNEDVIVPRRAGPRADDKAEHVEACTAWSFSYVVFVFSLPLLLVIGNFQWIAQG